MIVFQCSFVTAARRQFLLGTVLAKQKQELVTLITATLNLDLNLTCKLLDYTLDCSTTGKHSYLLLLNGDAKDRSFIKSIGSLNLENFLKCSDILRRLGDKY